MHQLLPVLPLAEGCLFPQSALEVSVAAVHATRAVEIALRTGGRVLVAAQRDQGNLRDLYEIGTVATIASHEPIADGGGMRIDLHGDSRGRAVTLIGVDHLVAEVELLPDGDAGEAWSSAVEPLARFLHAHQKLRGFLEERRRSQEPMAWINLVCQHLPIKLATRQQLLESESEERCLKIGRVLEALLQKKEQGS